MRHSTVISYLYREDNTGHFSLHYVRASCVPQSALIPAMSGIYSKWSLAEERSRLNMIGAAGLSTMLEA